MTEKVLDGRHGLWTLGAWCEQLGISLSSYYGLKEKPLAVRIGRLKRITESPTQYLERVQREQAAAKAG